MICLVSARTRLWLHGEIPRELSRLWEEAQQQIPDWPGFQRLKISDEQRDAVRAFQAELDAVEESLAEEFDEASISVDENGMREFEGVWRFDKKKKKRWWEFWR